MLRKIPAGEVDVVVGRRPRVLHLITSFEIGGTANYPGNGKASLFVYNASNGSAFLGIGDGAGGFAFHPLFISPGYRFKFVDNLITNFHVPRSSLMMLVAAFIGRKKLLDLYKSAIAKKFRLFSFGDGMLIK